MPDFNNAAHPRGGNILNLGQFRETHTNRPETRLLNTDEIPAVIDLAVERENRTVAQTLDACTDMFGNPLREDTRERLSSLISNPTTDTWEAGHSILVTPKTTVWQAVLEHTDYNVRTGPTRELVEEPTDLHTGRYEQTTGWSSVPTRAQILTALNAATQKTTNTDSETQS